MKVYLNHNGVQSRSISTSATIIKLFKYFIGGAMLALTAQLFHSAFAQSTSGVNLPGAQVKTPSKFHYPQMDNATKQPNISGIWKVDPYVFSRAPQAERMLKTLDGSPAPLQPWAAELYQKRNDESDAGRPFAASVSKCLPGGVPAMMLGPPYPFQIIQSPGQVTIIFEENHLYRIIYLDGKHPEDPDPTFIGHSIGHWEKDTLVVDTVALSEKTTLDFNGAPHSDELHVVERIRRLNTNTLEIIFTLDDPKAFTKSWQMRRTYKLLPPDEQIMEFICENQRNTPNADGTSGFGK